MALSMAVLFVFYFFSKHLLSFFSDYLINMIKKTDEIQRKRQKEAFIIK